MVCWYRLTKPISLCICFMDTQHVFTLDGGHKVVGSFETHVSCQTQVASPKVISHTRVWHKGELLLKGNKYASHYENASKYERQLIKYDWSFDRWQCSRLSGLTYHALNQLKHMQHTCFCHICNLDVGLLLSLWHWFHSVLGFVAGIAFLRGFQVSLQALGGSSVACQLFLFHRNLSLEASHAQRVERADLALTFFCLVCCFWQHTFVLPT